MAEDIRTDLNGLGSRITNVEVSMKSVETRTERNEKDIQKIFDSMAKLPYLVVGSISIPTLLLIYQIFAK